MDRNEFFALLDQLTPSEIEARLPLLDEEQLKLVEQYLARTTIKPALVNKPSAQSVSRLEVTTVAMAKQANKIATIALIIAVGAMITAITAGLVAYQALQFVAKG
jgi:hypothetical protein